MYQQLLEKYRFYMRLYYITGFGMIGGLVLLGFAIINLDLETMAYLFPYVLIIAVSNALFLCFSSNAAREIEGTLGDNSEEHY